MIDPNIVVSTAKTHMTRRGFSVVNENGGLRFVGAKPEVEKDVVEAIAAVQDGDSSPLTELLEDMGMVSDVEGRYLVATVA